MTGTMLQGHRLFLALLPPPDIARRIGELADALGRRGNVADARLHMTMGLLDDWPALDEDRMETAKAALLSVRAEPVRICLDRVSSSSATCCLIPGERAPALMELQRRISRAFDNARLPFAAHWSFRPHVTLFYKPSELQNDQIGPISWQATDVALVHSYIGLTRHEVVQRVTLAG